ncbi:MAG: adenylyltransferase [Rhodospirillaceae bacterium TMED8]|nr:adenylyltransferase [Magnetovibrio sp.]OUT50460.1 MAG: adenylyltransferase [Rhodospirillaceae bacterium TMED8]|tara:strand:+ start:2334 stop:3137 length:804 start_codon:yes stop_codon:yes gene_type:complete
MEFTEQQVNRYARHILLPEVGGLGQAKLIESRVLVIGAGGLGSPLVLYLAAAGIGTIGIIDDDFVELSNLQRQILYRTADVGKAKIKSAEDAITAINPDVQVEAHLARITAVNAADLINQYDLVADGSDNFKTRFLVNDACFFARVPLVSAAILRFDAQIATYRAFKGLKGQAAGPCYRCLFPEAPPESLVPTCAEAGVLGALCGMMGSFQATEVIKELLGIGESLSGSLIICDGLGADIRKIKVSPDPSCPLCGEAPSIKDLSIHE